jgi:cytochrome b6-f complex iron-sulfur subunit
MADENKTPPSADDAAEKPAEPAAEKSAAAPAKAEAAAPGDAKAGAPAKPAATAPAAATAAKPAAAARPPATAAKKPVAAKPAAAKAAAGADAKLKGRTTTAAAGTARKKKAAIPDDSPLMGRRGWMGLAWGSFTAATAGCLAATGRFMFPNVLNEPPQQFAIGFPEDYGDGVDERFKDRFGVWVVRTDNDVTHEASGFYALFSVCTHLGCTPNWLSAENKFKCPCHGSGFRPTGVNFEGPAPRPLERTRIVRAEDGQILVDKSRKFQQELGQWADPESFLPI